MKDSLHFSQTLCKEVQMVFKQNIITGLKKKVKPGESEGKINMIIHPQQTVRMVHSVFFHRFNRFIDGRLTEQH